MRHIYRSFFWIISGCLLCSSVGCAHPGEYFRSFDVSVSLDNTLRDNHGNMRTVEVDLVGVTDTDFPRWNDKSVNEYWTPNDPFHASADPGVLQFYNDPGPKVFPSSDRHWTQWLNNDDKAKQLFAICFIAGDAHTDGGPGDQDPWRLVLPLDKLAWDSSVSTVDLVVTSRGILCLTPYKTLEPAK